MDSDSAGSSIVVDSVSSAVSRRGSAPVRSRCVATRSAKSRRRSWRGETLKEICGCRPSSAQRTCCSHTAPTTQSPIASISPVSSASGMNSPGGTMPRSGSCQRSSASTPISPPRQTSKIGW